MKNDSYVHLRTGFVSVTDLCIMVIFLPKKNNSPNHQVTK